jgi:hypothetical protein
MANHFAAVTKSETANWPSLAAWNLTNYQRYKMMAKIRLNSPTLRAKVVAGSRHACG